MFHEKLECYRQSVELAEDFLKLVPHAKYVDVENARHMVAGDRNDIFGKAIEDFLSELVNNASE